MPPKKVNLGELSKDELIAVVHKINSQMLAAQQNGADSKAKAALERAMLVVEGERDEYNMRLQSAQEQISLLKDELSSRGDEVAALSNQLSILSDQLVEATSLQSSSPPPPVVAAVVETHRPSTPTPASPPAHVSHGPSLEEFEALQTRIVDLQETLDYYSAIVQAQDSGAARGATDTTTHVDLATHQEVLDELDQLKYHLQATETRCTTSRRDLSASQEQCAALHNEVSNLKQQLRGMDAVIRSVEAAAHTASTESSAAATVSSNSTGLVSPISSAAGTNGRVAAKIVFEGGVSRSPRPSTSVDANSRGRRGSTVQGGLPLLDFASLPDRSIKNPNPREKKLLDRLDIVERYALSLADYDISRQRSYDELERNRADLFAYLNESNQAQHEKIQALQKSVGTRDKRIAELEATMEQQGGGAVVHSSSSPATESNHVAVATVSTPQQTPHQWSTSTSTQFTDSSDMKKQVDTFGLPSDAGAQARLIAKIHNLEQRELQSEALLKMLRVHHESVLVRSAEFCQMVIGQSAMLGNELSSYKAATAASVDAGEVKSARHHLLQRLSMRLKVHPANPVYAIGVPTRSDTRSSRESLHTAEDGIVNDSLYSNPVDTTPITTTPTTMQAAESTVQEGLDAPIEHSEEDVQLPDEDPFPMASSSPSKKTSDHDDPEEEEARCGGFIPLEDGTDIPSSEPPLPVGNTQADDGWGTFQQVAPSTNTSSPPPAANHDFDPFA